MIWLAVFLCAVLAGVVQSLTGFGGAVMMMLVLPYYFAIPAASSIASAVCLGLNVVLLVKFRRHLDWHLWLLPTIPYLAVSTAVIHLVEQLDLRLLSVAFGGFLMLLSAYFLVFARHLSVTPSWKAAMLCGAIAGVTLGLFGIGGPLMSLYFLPTAKSKESYTANMQCAFFVANLSNMFSRLSCGIMPVYLIPLTLFAFLAVNVGKAFGLRILQYLDGQKIRTLVYAFVGVSGLITVLQNL